MLKEGKYKGNCFNWHITISCTFYNKKLIALISICVYKPFVQAHILREKRIHILREKLISESGYSEGERES